MVKRINDLSNVKGSKPAEQGRRVKRTETSAHEPISSRSAELLTRAAEKFGLSPNATEFLVGKVLGLKKKPKGIANG